MLFFERCLNASDARKYILSIVIGIHVFWHKKYRAHFWAPKPLTSLHNALAMAPTVVAVSFNSFMMEILII